jgi:hypothetical protein
MHMNNNNEMHRIPGFTAENVLVQRASAPYAGLALHSAGEAVEPTFVHCRVWCDKNGDCDYICTV